MDQQIGTLEERCMVSVSRTRRQVAAVGQVEELERVAGRSPSSGALYTTLDRMEKKGLLTSHVGEGSRERGGRPRRIVRVTPDGRELLARSRSTLLALWTGLEGRLES